jgi:hypothetical protein
MLETLSQIGELVGGLGALLALIYLALQIRQNNIIARAQARQTLLDTWSSGNWDLVRDTDLLTAFASGLNLWPDIPDDQRIKFDLGMSRFLTNIQNGLLLREAGLLDQAILDQTSNWMVASALSPGGHRWWKETAVVPLEVREYIDKRLANEAGQTVGLSETFPYWMSMAEGKSSPHPSSDVDSD